MIPEDDNTVAFDRDKLERLKHAYEVAKNAGVTSFVFDGREYVVRYAYYLIEYLDPKLPKGG